MIQPDPMRIVAVDRCSNAFAAGCSHVSARRVGVSSDSAMRRSCVIGNDRRRASQRRGYTNVFGNDKTVEWAAWIDHARSVVNAFRLLRIFVGRAAGLPLFPNDGNRAGCPTRFLRFPRHSSDRSLLAEMIKIKRTECSHTERAEVAESLADPVRSRIGQRLPLEGFACLVPLNETGEVVLCALCDLCVIMPLSVPWW